MYVRYKPSKKLRVWSVIVAFAIMFVGLPNLGVEVGLEADANSSTKTITTSTTETYYSSFASQTDGIYSYTGNVQAYTKVNMFDYVSDAEFVTGLGYGYNNVTHNTPYGGYDDAFTAFNYAVASSNSTIKSASSNNTTIKFKSTNNKCTRAYVHFWNTTSINTSWPGIPMFFNPTDNCFYLTVPNSVLGTNSPTFKINGGKNGSGGDTWQSGEKTIDQFGKQYYCELDEYDRFTDNTDYNHADYIPWIKDNADAQPIYNTKYTYPILAFFILEIMLLIIHQLIKPYITIFFGSPIFH